VWSGQSASKLRLQGRGWSRVRRSLKEEGAGARIAESLRRGVGISDRLIDYIEQEFRVDDWAQKNIEAIVGCRKIQ
jgi:hypothetical protein